MKRIMASLMIVLMLCTGTAMAQEYPLLNLQSMFPVTNEPAELELCILYDTSVYGEWDQLWWWHYMEEKTNVKVVPRLIAKDVWKEQSMIMLSSGDLPDVFFVDGWSTADVYEYGLLDGVFLPLNQYVEDKNLMPNLNAAFEMYPEAKAASTLPDGNIYGLPSMISEYYVMAAGTRAQWINQWLTEQGLKAEDIKTLDDFYNALVACRDGDHNQNGQADEIPWSQFWGTDGLNGMSAVVGYALNALGLATTDGLVAINTNDKTAGYAPMMDEYYEALSFLRKLYAEGLLDADLFSQSESDMTAKYAEERVAFSTYWNPGGACTAEQWAAHEASQYDGTVITMQSPLVDQADETPIVAVPSKHRMNVFVVTSACENPEVAMRWADACYDTKTSMYYRTGPEFGSEDDEWMIGCSVDRETNYVDGNWEQARAHWNQTDLTGWQWIQTHINSAASVAYFGLDECLGHRQYYDGELYTGGAPAWTDPYVRAIQPFEIACYPTVYYDEEQNRVIDLYKSSLDAFVIEQTAKFIAGETELDEVSWETFQSQLQAFNGTDYDNVLREAYAAFVENA